MRTATMCLVPFGVSRASVAGLVLVFTMAIAGCGEESAPQESSGGQTSSTSQSGANSSGGSLSSGGKTPSDGTTGPGSSGAGSESTGGNVGAGGKTTAGGTSGSGGQGGSSATTGGDTSNHGGGGASGAGGTIESGGTTSKGGTTSQAGSTSSGGSNGDGGSSVTSGIGPGDPPTKTYYVTTTGKPSNDGSSFANALDYATAFSKVAAGEMVLLQSGTYSVSAGSGKNTIAFAKKGQSSKPIRIVTDANGYAVFDFSYGAQDWTQDGWGFDLSGDYYYFRGVVVTRAGYQGVYVRGGHNTFENCSFHDNRNTGIEINEGGSYTTLINCDAYRNYDPKKKGSMADGFGPKQQMGPGNKLIGCRAWENSDDGVDLFDSPQTVTIENSWAFRNGVDVWNYGGFDGNGNGFKLGGNYAAAAHKITNSVAFGNRVKGFDQNHNTGGITVTNCTAYKNATNFSLGEVPKSGKHLLRNNVSVGASNSIAGADAKNNSWDLGIAASDSDFVNVTLSLATAARRPGGALPNNGLFRLASGSKLVDAGTDAGLPFAGKAPDLGAFESN